MTGLMHVGQERVPSLAERKSRRHWPKEDWRWQRRPGPGTGFRLQPRVGRTADESDVVRRSREHVHYLNRMAAEGVLPPALATKAKTIWWIARALAEGVLSVPAAAAFSGGPVEYQWSVGSHQVLAEIPADGPCHWTYRNGNTDELWGIEAAADDGLPPRLIRALTRIAASSP